MNYETKISINIPLHSLVNTRNCRARRRHSVHSLSAIELREACVVIPEVMPPLWCRVKLRISDLVASFGSTKNAYLSRWRLHVGALGWGSRSRVGANASGTIDASAGKRSGPLPRRSLSVSAPRTTGPPHHWRGPRIAHAPHTPCHHHRLTSFTF